MGDAKPVLVQADTLRDAEKTSTEPRRCAPDWCPDSLREAVPGLETASTPPVDAGEREVLLALVDEVIESLETAVAALRRFNGVPGQPAEERGEAIGVGEEVLARLMRLVSGKGSEVAEDV